MHRRGFTRGAIDVLEVQLAQTPDDGHLRQVRALLLYHLGRLTEALRDVEQAQLLVPLDSATQFVYAECLVHEDHHELAGDAYLALAERCEPGDDFLPLVQRGLGRLGRWEDVARLCRQALDHTPDDDWQLYLLSRASLHLGQPADAVVPLLRRAVYLAPAVERYRAALAVQLVEQRRCDEAYHQLRQLPVAALDGICCKGCLRRLLELAMAYGDSPRAAAFAAQLASFVPQSTADGGSHHD
ncbi:tetratricopeptide repeat protein [Aeoliella sp.]|uniref:tetratricopeptide repeat protein n=1 Tax=Aeoliella sp. TaxID=2795800 RepID=UPI003CCC3C67